MRKIEFIAGYYEWKLLVDNELLFVENDSEWSDLFTTENELKAYIDTFIIDYYDNVARGNFMRHEDTFNAKLWITLCDSEIVAIKNAIYDKWLKYI